ncbi:nicotinate-nucleotide--dimethylbenzimidazole phosphoribosyltransferase [Sulfobacillus thermosulfidooxidans]|uniref:nicotinate-nucleotide--dimethylbenzimidazole phosphoribosyltransferase n=1 Tax=Sulfobacillus thermosulfidooxidans TaxID=28034 RepID=UPI00096B9EFD|nr:nicotinate-nucleotide--dimethylbenzimidazole phosphoribosyltransferase [Sulfobacillus thermosulfidooxidans]
MNRQEIEIILNKVTPPSMPFRQRAQERMDNLTKPLGSLGLLENIVVQLAAIQRKIIPELRKPHALIFAADHGVSEEHVSRYEDHVTEEMAVNIAMETAVSSVLARHNQIPLDIVDVGVKSVVRHPKVIVQKIRAGTHNIVYGPAMTSEDVDRALHVGYEIATEIILRGTDVLIAGELGISNTTSSTAMACALLQRDPREMTGMGSGIDDDHRMHKVNMIAQALAVNQVDPEDYWDVLTKLGGLEIAALVGAYTKAVESGIPIILDGLITTVAALGLVRVNAECRQYFIAAHESHEPSHQALLTAMDLKPLLKWDMRLGEASGALLVFPLLQQGCAILKETATFADARVSNPHAKESLMVEPVPLEHPVRTDFSESERESFYRVIMGRRDIRIYLPDPIPQVVLQRVLMAAHHAPSVGFMQPWNFIVIDNPDIKRRLHEVVEQQRVVAAQNYTDMRQLHYLRLKVEGLLEAPVTICVTNDSHRGGPHVLGRNTIPETDLMSTACAIENMWLAARVEGLGMGWVSIFRKEDVREILGIPDHIDPIALMTVGYTPYFPEIPLLERVGWEQRRPFDDLVYFNRWSCSDH